MLEAKEIDEFEVTKQVMLFTHALRSIIQGHELCKDKAIVASFADYNYNSPGASLVDGLCELIEDMETGQNYVSAFTAAFLFTTVF